MTLFVFSSKQKERDSDFQSAQKCQQIHCKEYIANWPAKCFVLSWESFSSSTRASTQHPYFSCKNHQLLLMGFNLGLIYYRRVKWTVLSLQGPARPMMRPLAFFTFSTAFSFFHSPRHSFLPVPPSSSFLFPPRPSFLIPLFFFSSIV